MQNILHTRNWWVHVLHCELHIFAVTLQFVLKAHASIVELTSDVLNQVCQDVGMFLENSVNYRSSSNVFAKSKFCITIFCHYF